MTIDVWGMFWHLISTPFILIARIIPWDLVGGIFAGLILLTILVVRLDRRKRRAPSYHNKEKKGTPPPLPEADPAYTPAPDGGVKSIGNRIKCPVCKEMVDVGRSDSCGHPGCPFA